MLWHIELKFCKWLCFTVLQIKFECRQFASIFMGVMPLLELRILEIQFSVLFSYMLWYIEVEFCIWLCFTVLQIKFDCHQFVSSFVGVMPLLELRILEIQFSTFFFYMLWHIEMKFCIWLYFTILQIKFECREFASIFVGVMSLLELRILKIHSFPHFSLTCFDILRWNFAYDFVDFKFECRQFASIFVGVMSLLELRILEIRSFPHFSLTCFDILSWNFANDFVLLYYRSSSSVVNLRQFLWELCPFRT